MRKREVPLAIVTMRQLDQMTPRGHRRLAAWLRATATFVERKGTQCASRVTARYFRQ